MQAIHVDSFINELKKIPVKIYILECQNFCSTKIIKFPDSPVASMHYATILNFCSFQRILWRQYWMDEIKKLCFNYERTVK